MPVRADNRQSRMSDSRPRCKCVTGRKTRVLILEPACVCAQDTLAGDMLVSLMYRAPLPEGWEGEARAVVKEGLGVPAVGHDPSMLIDHFHMYRTRVSKCGDSRNERRFSDT
jgi:hypothetical protein